MKEQFVVARLDLSNQEVKQSRDSFGYPLYEPLIKYGVKIVFEDALKNTEIIKEDAKNKFKYQERNIIAFMGERGSGKTTVLNQFCLALEDLQIEKNRMWWMNQVLNSEQIQQMKDFSFLFRVVSPIDAHLLGKVDGDGFFELLLASIYQTFSREIQDKIENSEEVKSGEEASQLFMDIYEAHHAREKGEDFLDSPFLMEKLASTYIIQEKIARLLDIMLDRKEVKEYVLIVIDDLDLNMRYGYDYLEILQKYYSDPRILIVTAIDYDQMSKVLDKSLQDDQLTKDLLLKIFPISRRIFMPHFRETSKQLRVIENWDDDDMDHSMNERKVQIKNFVIKIVAEVLQIHYDACGLKWHFCEPNTIRTLINYYRFIRSMEIVDYGILKTGSHASIRKELLKCDRNYERMNQDIQSRLAEELSYAWLKELFMDIMSRDLQRHVAYVIGLEEDEMPNGKAEDSRFRLILKENTGSYSFGQFVQQIHDLGRKRFEYKAFIRCILASFSVEMVSEYINFRYTKNKLSPELKTRNEQAKRNLMAFLGSNFVGSWLGDMKPFQVYSNLGGREDTEKNRHRKGMNPYMLNREMTYEIFFDADLLLTQTKGIGVKKRLQILRRWVEEKKVIETLELIDMFFLSTKAEKDDYEGLEFVSKGVIRGFYERDTEGVKVGSEDNGTWRVTASSKDKTFDFLGWIGKSLDIEKQKDRLHKNMKKILMDAVMRTSGGKIGEEKIFRNKDLSELENGIESIIEEYSIFNQEGNVDEVAFPFYDLDLSYNICKRLRRKCKREYEHMENNKFENAYRILLENMEALLKDEEEKYKEFSNELFHYLEYFEESVYVKFLKSCFVTDREEKYRDVRNRFDRVLDRIQWDKGEVSIISSLEPQGIDSEYGVF